jgi:DNA-binding MarR family transcriptional regulator
VKEQYLVTTRLIERLHRRFLDVIKAELDRLSILDINNVQTLILFNISEDQLTVGELTRRGYYLGSNVSYNVKKLVELGYLHHARSRIDRRSVRISLTEKGAEVHNLVKGVYDKHVRTVEQIGGIAADDFERMNNALLRLERFWTDQIRYKL